MGGAKTCLFWDCGSPIRADRLFCYGHYQDYREGEVDLCPDCKRGKLSQYELCLECEYDPHSRKSAPAGRIRERYEPEYSAAWEERDAAATRFFVYILKLDGGTFYAGQTRELRERLAEHRDGAVSSTAGRKPKFVWFAVVSTREDATRQEVELKKLVDSNPREIRRMVVGFHDLVRELDYD